MKYIDRLAALDWIMGADWYGGPADEWGKPEDQPLIELMGTWDRNTESAQTQKGKWRAMLHGDDLYLVAHTLEDMERFRQLVRNLYPAPVRMPSFACESERGV